VHVHTAQVARDHLHALRQRRRVCDIPPALERHINHAVVGCDDQRRPRGKCVRQLLDNPIQVRELASPRIAGAPPAVTGGIEVAEVDVDERAVASSYRRCSRIHPLPHRLGARVAAAAQTGLRKPGAVEGLGPDPGDLHAGRRRPFESRLARLQGPHVDVSRQCQRVDHPTVLRQPHQ
jgi:hypothetical protein